MNLYMYINPFVFNLKIKIQFSYIYLQYNRNILSSNQPASDESVLLGISSFSSIRRLTWISPENVHHSASTTKNRVGHVLLLTKPEKSEIVLLGFSFQAGEFLG